MTISYLLIPQRSAALLFHGPEKTNVSLVSLCLWASSLPFPHSRPPLHLRKDPQRTFCPFQPSSPLETHTHPHLMGMPKFQNQATRPLENSLKCRCGCVCCQAHPAFCQQGCKSGGLDSSPGHLSPDPHCKLEETPPHGAQMPCKRGRGNDPHDPSNSTKQIPNLTSPLRCLKPALKFWKTQHEMQCYRYQMELSSSLFFSLVLNRPNLTEARNVLSIHLKHPNN